MPSFNSQHFFNSRSQELARRRADFGDIEKYLHNNNINGAVSFGLMDGALTTLALFPTHEKYFSLQSVGAILTNILAFLLVERGVLTVKDLANSVTTQEIEVAYEKKYGPCEFKMILEQHIFLPACITSDAGAVSVQGIAKLGQWIATQCLLEDSHFYELIKSHGQSFYDRERHVLRLEMDGQLPSACLLISLRTGTVIAAMSDVPNSARALCDFVQMQLDTSTTSAPTLAF